MKGYQSTDLWDILNFHLETVLLLVKLQNCKNLKLDLDLESKTRFKMKVCTTVIHWNIYLSPSPQILNVLITRSFQAAELLTDVPPCLLGLPLQHLDALLIDLLETLKLQSEMVNVLHVATTVLHLFNLSRFCKVLYSFSQTHLYTHSCLAFYCRFYTHSCVYKQLYCSLNSNQYLVDRSVGRLVGQTVAQLVVRLVGWLVSRSVGWYFGIQRG